MNHMLTVLLYEEGLNLQGVLQPLSGGDSAAPYRLQTREGDVVVKHDHLARLVGEADGLKALEQLGGAGGACPAGGVAGDGGVGNNTAPP